MVGSLQGSRWAFWRWQMPACAPCRANLSLSCVWCALAPAAAWPQSGVPYGQVVSSSSINYTCAVMGAVSGGIVSCAGLYTGAGAAGLDLVPVPLEMRSVAVAAFNACGILLNLTLVCWGYAVGTRLEAPAGMLAVGIACGTYHSDCNSCRYRYRYRYICSCFMYVTQCELHYYSELYSP